MKDLPVKDREIVPLVVYIMEERRNPESKWANYFSVLPKDMSGHPIFFSNADLDFFKGDEMGGYIKSLASQLDETYRTVASVINDFRVNYPE